MTFDRQGTRAKHIPITGWIAQARILCRIKAG